MRAWPIISARTRMLTDCAVSTDMVWQEIFDNGAKIAKDTVIDVWKGGNWQEEMGKVTSAGFHTGKYYYGLFPYNP